jgi:hypothetical protein
MTGQVGWINDGLLLGQLSAATLEARRDKWGRSPKEDSPAVTVVGWPLVRMLGPFEDTLLTAHVRTRRAVEEERLPRQQRRRKTEGDRQPRES